MRKKEPGRVQPRKAYQKEDVAASYDSKRFTSWYGKLCDQREKSVFLRALDLVGVARIALDAPCGTARMTLVLLERGLQVVGLDISEQMLRQARKKTSTFSEQLELRVGDLIELPFGSDLFDVVSCVRLFGHYPSSERIEMLREMNRVSKKYVIVQYFYETRLTRLKRWVKRRWSGMYVGVSYPVDEATLCEEYRSAGMQEEGRFWCCKYYSEELFILLSKVPCGHP